MNLTATVGDEVLRRPRIRALEQGTSVNAVLRELLESSARTDVEMVRRAIATSRRSGLAVSDAPIVEAAGSGGRQSLLSEDLQAGQTSAGRVVENPFAR